MSEETKVATEAPESKEAAAPEFEERLVKVNRVSATIKGGRRFSFSATVVVGDGTGNVGLGYGKAVGVAPAIQKATKAAKKTVSKVALNGDTIPFQVQATVGTSSVRLLPASAGTGVIAGAAVRAVVESAGVKDVLSKVYGSTNPINVVKATLKALQMLRTREEAQELRGVKI